MLTVRSSIAALDGLNVDMIAAGDFHTLCRTSTGKLYAYVSLILFLLAFMRNAYHFDLSAWV